ncbi:carbohydrate ABC transporter permease, partial [Streptomyces sp. PAL114]
MSATTTTPRRPSFAPRPKRSAGRADRPQTWGSPVTYFIALLFVGVCVAPVVYIVIGGFRTNAQITTEPAALPSPWVTGNYLGILKSSVFWGEFANSLIVALASTVGIVALGLMVSFVIARYDFRLKGALYSLFAAGLMFPMVIAITPLYLVIRDLGLVDNLLGVIVPQIAFGLPTTVIILVPFLRAIPNEIEEAAAIDGMSRLGFFFRMAVPLSLPGVVTVGILGFVGSWNNYLLPLYVL